MAAKEELVLQLFDLYWFKLQILVHQQEKEEEESSKPEKLSSIHVNEPLSNKLLISKEISNGRTESPNSVLARSSFDSIISDEESDEKKKKKKRKKQGRGRRLRKSTAELEMEELKGFKELGLVLSEESPRLVSILPGLRRLKERDNGTAINGGEEEEITILRPYLSEAWSWKKEKKEERMATVLRWRIPSLRSEVDMKKSLKTWARTVASAVR